MLQEGRRTNTVLGHISAYQTTVLHIKKTEVTYRNQEHLHRKWNMPYFPADCFTQGLNCLCADVTSAHLPSEAKCNKIESLSHCELTNLNQPPLPVATVTSCSKWSANSRHRLYQLFMQSHFIRRQISALIKRSRCNWGETRALLPPLAEQM